MPTLPPDQWLLRFMTRWREQFPNANEGDAIGVALDRYKQDGHMEPEEAAIAYAATQG